MRYNKTMKTRNPYAVHASFRRSHPFKHRTAPRGGATNTQSSLLEEWSDDTAPPTTNFTGWADELEDL